MTWGETLSLVASFAGGLGFFLLGMHQLTEGLKLAAGGALRRILESSTSTRLLRRPISKVREVSGSRLSFTASNASCVVECGPFTPLRNADMVSAYEPKISS